jgi:hypothetical protein
MIFAAILSKRMRRCERGKGMVVKCERRRSPRCWGILLAGRMWIPIAELPWVRGHVEFQLGLKVKETQQPVLQDSHQLGRGPETWA